MSLDIKIKEKKKSPLDINRVFPGYISKNIFRGVIIVMLIFTFLVYYSNGNTLRFEFGVCPEYYTKPCYNTNFNAFGEVGSCEATEYLNPGETCGNEPNMWARHYNKISLLFVLFGFIINHLFYYFKTGKFRIPFDRNAWTKHPLSKINTDLKEDKRN